MELIKKYKGKKLTPDEYAIARNEVNETIKALKDLDFEVQGDDYLTLKWGTLKEWNFTSEKGKELLKEYFEIGSSASAMMQKDLERQKAIILELIDECNGPIQSDWTGEYFTKKQAREYVTDYKN